MATDNRSNTASRKAGIVLSGGGFVVLTSGLVIFAIYASWSHVAVSLCMIFGAALLITGALLNGPVASAFATPVAVIVLALPHVQSRTPFLSFGGILITLVGAVLLLQGLVVHRHRMRKLLTTPRGREKLQKGVNTLLVIYLVVVANMISARHYGRVDLTGSALFELSPKTKQVIGNIDGQVRIIELLYGEEEELAGAFRHIREILKEYDSLGKDKVVVESPRSEAELKALRLELKQEPIANSLTIIYGEGEQAREKRIMGAELVESAKIPSGGAVGPVTVKAEDVITSAIIQVVEGQKKKVFFVAGNGELDPLKTDTDGASKIVLDLLNDNYQANRIDLAENEMVPEDCAVLVIAGPRTQFKQKELDLVADYLSKQKGRLLVMLDPIVKGWEPSGLEALLQDWGIKVRTDALAVKQARSARQALSFEPLKYPAAAKANPIVQPLHNMKTSFEIVSPLELIEETRYPVACETLVESVKGAWGEVNFRKVPWQQEPEDIQGPLPFVVSVREKDPTATQSGPLVSTSPDEYHGARLVVSGDSNLIVNRSATTANRTLILNSINWLTQQKSKLGIQPKTLQIGTISYTPSQAKVIGLMAVLGLPAIALVAGFVMYLLRQK